LNLSEKYGNSFLNSLESLEINGCTFSKNYHFINDLILKIPNLKNLSLIGTSLAENLGESSLKKPIFIVLQYNGIEANVLKSYLRHLFDFEKV
jgi:hypothetical protein